MRDGFLALETSTPEGSVALVTGAGETLFSERFQAGRSHSALLFAVLERALKAGAAAGIASPGHLVAGLGPGSYAGVRIAIAAATGLGLARGAALLGIPSVAALAEGEYLAVGDARRESYYFAHVRDGVCREGPALFPLPELEARLAAEPSLPVFASEPLGAVPHATLRFPCAERLARLAVAGRGITTSGALEPIYLREPHITAPKAS